MAKHVIVECLCQDKVLTINWESVGEESRDDVDGNEEVGLSHSSILRNGMKSFHEQVEEHAA